MTRPGQQGGLGPHLWSALKVTANNESRMSHDFRSHPLASIPFQVVVENPTSEGAAFAYKVSSCDDTPSSSVFVGCTQANLTVQANQVWSLTTIFFLSILAIDGAQEDNKVELYKVQEKFRSSSAHRH